MITIVVPTFNEQDNILSVHEEVTNIMKDYEGLHAYEILFVDNFSTDHSRVLISKLCKEDAHVKAIFNAKNFGYSRSLFYGLRQAKGDCAILLHADLQNPPAVMKTFITYWEEGYKVVIGIKNKSKENKIMYFIRTCYYKIIKHISDVDQIEHFTEYELLDRSFLDVLNEIEDPLPYLRGIISEFGFGMKKVYFTQEKRKKGKSYATFFKAYDFAMLGITSYSKTVLRLCTLLGFVFSFISILIAVFIFVTKLLNWESYAFGTAAVGVGIFFFGSIQLFFIGMLGEYVMNINTRVMRRPLVIEEKRINY